MFSLTFFTEILVVGVLLILGLSPIWTVLLKMLNAEERFDVLKKLEEKSALILIVFILAYATGVLGNRLVDQILPDDGDKTSQQAIMSLAQSRRSAQQSSGVNVTCIQGEESDEECSKVVVTALKERDASIAEWFERHKSYIRVQRA